MVGLVGAAALSVTTAIIHQGGIQQTATADGALLAWAAIVVHFGGVVVFGGVVGFMLKTRNYIGAVLGSLMVMGAAMYSGWQIATFATAELISVTKAREVAEQRETERHKADLDAAAERRKTQAELAKQQLKWLQIETRSADGRRQRTDSMEQGTKLVLEMGKAPDTQTERAPLSVRTEKQVKADAFVAWLAGAAGWNQAALQASPTVWLAFMIILYEIVAWPLTIFLWLSSPETAPLVPATAVAFAPAVTTEALIVEPERTFKALPPPRAARDKAITVRASPSKEWRALLDKLDFPAAGTRHKGPRRSKDARDHAALRFLVWLGAYKEGGEYPQAEVDTLYSEFCAMDHREQWAIRIVKSDLEALGNKVARKWPGADGVMWTIVPPPIERLTTLLERRGLIAPGGIVGIASAGVLRFPKEGRG